MDYAIVIPARHASQRLPGKMLLDLGGKPLLQRTWDCARASGAGEVVIATDDERIANAAEAFGACTMLTSPDHASGSDRIAECARRLGWRPERLIVNLQGDEPHMPATCLDQVAALLDGVPDAGAATLCWPIEDAAEVDDPNVVKAVFSTDGDALWFSRSRLPHARDWPNPTDAMRAGVQWFRHLGLYAYRHAALQDFTRLPPTPLERLERLEQLRFLESGRRMRIAVAAVAIPPGIDTPADLERARRLLADN